MSLFLFQMTSWVVSCNIYTSFVIQLLCCLQRSLHFAYMLTKTISLNLATKLFYTMIYSKSTLMFHEKQNCRMLRGRCKYFSILTILNFHLNFLDHYHYYTHLCTDQLLSLDCHCYNILAILPSGLLQVSVIVGKLSGILM